MSRCYELIEFHRYEIQRETFFNQAIAALKFF